MKISIRDILIGICLGSGAAAVAAPTGGWITDAVTVYLPQSEVVRHPVDNGKYYLCWTDGVTRNGIAFRRTTMDQAIRSIPRAGRAPVSSLFASSGASSGPISPWSASDDNICWPK